MARAFWWLGSPSFLIIHLVCSLVSSLTLPGAVRLSLGPLLPGQPKVCGPGFLEAIVSCYLLAEV